MLRELHISNLAVIADARVELTRGLNCFTGATGAGKSLVIGAIEILLGLRSPAEMLRKGADEGRVSGVFETGDKRLLKRIAEIADVPMDSGDVLLTRRLFASGRSSVSLNGLPITLAMLKAIGEELVDVHGQHDHQLLLRPSNQLDTLDDYAGLHDTRAEAASVWTKLQGSRTRLAELRTGAAIRAQQLDLYRYQADEVDAAQLSQAEFDRLTARSGVLNNLDKIRQDAGATYAAMIEADESVLERLKVMAATLAELSQLDGSVTPIAQSVREASIQFEDAAFELGRYLDRLDLDPAELAETEERLNTINRVLNKYGGDINTVLAHRQRIGAVLAELEKAGDDSEALQKQIAPLEKKHRELSTELRKSRVAAATKLSKLIEAQLADLGMEKAKLTIILADAPPGSSGSDAIEFVAETNPGLPPQPLRKIASGGEMSRIMLALKGVLAAGDRVSVLVFDEIDSNVGGRLGSVIGDRLRALAAHHQVLCITHLPQIASYADRHLTVRKEQSGGATSTTVRTMTGDDRIEELAEMIGGRQITETTRAQARELLDVAAPSAAAGSKPAKTKSRRSA